MQGEEKEMKLPIRHDSRMNTLLDAEGFFLTNSEEIEFVVKAVNKHERLVEAAEYVLENMEFSGHGAKRLAEALEAMKK